MKEVTFTEDGAAAANNALGVMIDENGNCVKIANGPDATKDAEDSDSDLCVKAGDERFPKSDNLKDPTPREQFTEYLADKYSRLSPSYRLVRSAATLKASEEADIADGAEGWSRLVIMETTIDQLNSFAEDNLGFAVFYASHY